MPRTSASLLAVLSLLSVPAAHAADAPVSEGARWWKHVEFLASDALEGRNTGSEGYRKAAAYVAEQLAAAGVKPGAGEGYLQEMDLVSRRLVEERSRLVLVRGGKELPLTLGQDAIISARMGESGKVDAPMVFVGYGLSIPEAGHDELAGVDLQGKVAVILQGGPEKIPGTLRAHHGSMSERVKALKKAGAMGLVMLQNPKLMEVPWERTAGSRKMASMMFADPTLNDDQGLKVSVVVNTARAQKLFAGAPHTYEALVALANADKPLPGFALPSRLKAELAFETEPVKSANVVGVLPGSDPTLAREYVVVSAHLDHVGVGEPVKGDRIYNGAMDNASGVAAVLELARALQASETKPRRSVLFALVTGEEKGLLGSKYFAARPTVPRESLVADLNLDMFLPLFPFTHVVAFGMDESTLAAPLRQVAGAQGVKVLADPQPNRMGFIRSDQYSFIREGVPALAFKFGFEPGSKEEKLQKQWYSERYHGPADDLSQPVDKEGAAKFVRMFTALTRAVADAPERPRWNEQSFFRRFAMP
ncbi:M20/M25/M40 family metallo-hydrolase [Archangium violaceum]|uniref:M20/M25/M40 family metallo-hydrolase n=1 Tax=Archangium violaceum TaxID=83451 RepID=UPI001951448E|nr:M20/M25/M40 family metallo-hydrolase [Archangium violaceum]QRN95826.1 M20/M25/M40 family metallo-hydrolase [Archangium violaceum]